MLAFGFIQFVNGSRHKHCRQHCASACSTVIAPFSRRCSRGASRDSKLLSASMIWTELRHIRMVQKRWFCSKWAKIATCRAVTDFRMAIYHSSPSIIHIISLVSITSKSTRFDQYNAAFIFRKSCDVMFLLAHRYNFDHKNAFANT